MVEKIESRLLAGKSVVDTSAMTIGKVKDIMINLTNWSVVYILVKMPRQVTKELGVGGLMGATARVTPEFIERIGDLVKLNVEAKELVEKVEMD